MFDEKTFLYVEDDALSREILKMIMVTAMQVKQVVCFEDSRNFIQRLEALPAPPDVILLDLYVKPTDAFTLLGLIRKSDQYREIPVIALTTGVMNVEFSRLRTEGFDGAIVKPLSVSIFPTLIERILGGESVWHVA